MNNKRINIIFSVILVITVCATSFFFIRSHNKKVALTAGNQAEETETFRPDGIYSESGSFVFYKDGKKSTETGFIYGEINGEKANYYCKNGVIDFTYNALIKKENNIWWYVKNGKVYEETDKTILIKLNENFSAGFNEDKFSFYGGYVLSDESEKIIKDTIEAVEKKGYDVGICVYDLNTLGGFSYKADDKIYSASAIKGPYVVSLVDYDNSLLQKEKVRINAILRNSSNIDYESLRLQYGDNVICNWSVNSKNFINKDRDYQYLTPRQLSELWLSNYVFFESSDIGEETGKLFENPAHSPINTVFKDNCITRTKAGWVEKNNIRVTNDAGIIYVNDNAYLVTIMTTAPCNFKVVENAEVLDISR